MFCEKYKNTALLYLYDELEQDVEKDFLKHLSTCEKCRQELASLKTTQEAVRSIPLDDVESSRIESILNKAQAGASASEKLKSLMNHARQVINPMPRIAWIGTAALAVIFLLFFWHISPFESEPTMNQKRLLQWDANLNETIDSLEDEMSLLMDNGDALVRETIDKELFENKTEHRLDHVRDEILSLYKEINKNSF